MFNPLDVYHDNIPSYSCVLLCTIIFQLQMFVYIFIGKWRGGGGKCPFIARIIILIGTDIVYTAQLKSYLSRGHGSYITLEYQTIDVRIFHCERLFSDLTPFPSKRTDSYTTRDPTTPAATTSRITI